MPKSDEAAFHGLDEQEALRAIVEGTATETGERFFRALVKSLAGALNTCGAWVTEYAEEARRLHALAFWMKGDWVEDYEYDISGTPCELCIKERRLIHAADNVTELFPGDPDLKKYGAVSYLGVPLLDVDETVLGHLAVLHDQPLPEEPRALALFRIFAGRASAELQRLRAEAEVHEREEKLGQLVGGAMDAIIELAPDRKVTMVNPAAEKVFECEAGQFLGQKLDSLLTEESRPKLVALMRELDARPEGERTLWIPGGLRARRRDRTEFPVEATLSSYPVRRQTVYTLILRNVNARLEAERRIHHLTAEAEYLKEEIRALQNFDEIIGESRALLEVLQDVRRVAPTETTVLILGETGTGKELIARALHAESRRRGQAFVKVNCPAIPATLMESEFFGHEKGAFTGATAKREGRFALADGGTLFLDEIGELPPDLQAKLLRVLQEGEFEPVGSSKTMKVDVRVVAATNRDLEQEVKEGRFRNDLYFRLNVFPLKVPPLRERGGDIARLASALAERMAQRMGRPCEPLSADCVRRLRTYNWPGNVRELQNVIERAVITSQGGKLNLDRALPEATAEEEPGGADLMAEEPGDRILTVQGLEKLERQNLIRALEAAGWRVSGKKGAAERLGMNPSTLSSRMKALQIKRPRQA